jgi:PST family polysaccharide transporter
MRGVALTFGGQGLRFLVKIATQILIARLLTPGDYGLVAMVAPILALSTLLGDLGLGQTAVLKRDITAAQTSALLWFGLLLNGLIAAGLIALSPLIAWLYREPRVLLITVVLAGLLPLSGLAVQHVARLNREMRFARLALIDVAAPAVALAVGLACARRGWGYWSLLAAVGSETATTAALAWALSGWWPDRPRRGQGIRKLLAVGSHLTTTNLALYVTASLDNVLLGTIQGSTALGLYNRGYRLITQSVEQLIAPTSRIAVPWLNRLKEDPARYRAAWRNLLQAMMLAGGPGILWVMIEAQPLVQMVLGPQWAGVAPVFFWLGLGALAAPLNIATCWLFVTQEQTARQARYVVLASIFAVLSFIAGLPWGPVGVSAAASIAFWLLSIPMYCWASTRRSRVRLADIAEAMLPMICATGTSAAVLLAARNLLQPSGALRLLEMLVLAYVSFTGFLAVLPIGQPVIHRAWRLGKTIMGAQHAG